MNTPAFAMQALKAATPGSAKLLGTLSPGLSALAGTQATAAGRGLESKAFAQALQQASQPGVQAAPAAAQAPRPAASADAGPSVSTPELTRAAAARTETANRSNRTAAERTEARAMQRAQAEASTPAQAKGPSQADAARAGTRDAQAAAEADAEGDDAATEDTAADASTQARGRKLRPLPGLARGREASGGAGLKPDASASAEGADTEPAAQGATRRKRAAADADVDATPDLLHSTTAAAAAAGSDVTLARSAASREAGDGRAEDPGSADAGDVAARSVGSAREATAAPTAARAASGLDLGTASDADAAAISVADDAMDEAVTTPDEPARGPRRTARPDADVADRASNPALQAGALSALAAATGPTPAATAQRETAVDALATRAGGADARLARSELGAGAASTAAASPAAAAPASAAWATAWAAATGTAHPPEGAAPPPAELRLNVPVDAPDFLPRLGHELAILTREGVQEARVQLNPAELGPIAVQITLDGQAAQVHLAVDHAQTHALLEQSMPSLAAALREQGLTLTGGGVSQQSRQSGREGGSGDDGTGARRGRDDATAGVGAASGTMAAPRRVRSGAALDLYA